MNEANVFERSNNLCIQTTDIFHYLFGIIHSPTQKYPSQGISGGH